MTVLRYYVVDLFGEYSKCFEYSSSLTIDRFAAKVANRWYCRNTIIIGDAAHVFPPFGGQGIASGIRDAHALGWRLAMMEHQNLPFEAQQRMLQGWNLEQRQRVDDATRQTMVNGEITNERNWLLGLLHRTVMQLLWTIPGMISLFTHKAFGDTFKFTDCANGCFITAKGGGRKLSQIWIRKLGGAPQLSDEIFFRQRSKFAMLVMTKQHEVIDLNLISNLIQEAGFPQGILSIDSVTFLEDRAPINETEDQKRSEAAVYYPVSAKELELEGITPINAYDERTLSRRVGGSAKYVIVRPDFFIHSVATTPEEFKQNAKLLLGMLL